MKYSLLTTYTYKKVTPGLIFLSRVSRKNSFKLTLNSFYVILRRSIIYAAVPQNCGQDKKAEYGERFETPQYGVGFFKTQFIPEFWHQKLIDVYPKDVRLQVEFVITYYLARASWW